MFRAMGQDADIPPTVPIYAEPRNGSFCLKPDAFDAIPRCQAWEDSAPPGCWDFETASSNPDCAKWGEENPPPHQICQDRALLRLMGGDSEEAILQRGMLDMAMACDGRLASERPTVTDENQRQMMASLALGLGAVTVIGLGVWAFTKK
jgi:hypothetical protein